MSFLNPVNEPVLRFSSTDADAPQINYNARVAGDVKAVLKACLVTGYGATASAGWSIVNEVDHVAEFVSPAAAMSDYRLGVDDTSASSTTWYYQYQDARTDAFSRGADRVMTNINKQSARNGWELLVTPQGVLFVEIMQVVNSVDMVARLTYFGRLKSMLVSGAEPNIAFYNLGWHGITNSNNFFDIPTKNKLHCKLLELTDFSLATIDLERQLKTNVGFNLAVDINSNIFIKSSAAVVACLPAIFSRTPATLTDIFNISEIKLDGRDFLSLTATYQFADLASRSQLATSFVVPLDYWEY